MIVGVYKKSRNFGFVIPDDQAVSGDIYIPKRRVQMQKTIRRWL